MSEPPATPAAKALRRVIAVAGMDGWSVVALGGASTVLTVVLLQPTGLMVSVLVLAGGLIELRGRRKLRRRDPDGMRLLVRAQVLILGVILVYCLRCVVGFDATYVHEEVIPDANQTLQSVLGVSLDEFLADSGLTTADLVPLARQAFMLTYAIVAVVSLLFQGGLALYYRRRIPLVREALAAPPILPASPSS